MTLHRRSLLAGTAAALCFSPAQAITVQGSLPWRPDAGEPPLPVQPGQWIYFTPEEGAAVEAMMDRLIPADGLSPGGKDSGCAVYLDRQLAGPYGSSEHLYMRPPFHDGLPNQGPQSPLTPSGQYRRGLAALAAHCRAAYAGKQVHELPAGTLDELLTGLEKDQVKLEGINGKGFFTLLLKDAKEGFFADPVYGGNVNMVSWRMIGFPGARYDYRDWVGRHNEKYPLPPVSIHGRPEWAAAGKG